MIADLLRIVACYIAGMFCACLLLVPFYGSLSLALFMFGLMMALPLLAPVILAFIFFRGVILRHLTLVSVMMPLAVTAGWALMLWLSEGRPRERSLADFFADRAALELTAIGGLCAACSCALFWLWHRRLLPPDHG